MKQRIQSDLTISTELQRLIDDARQRDVSEEELREQRISFAYGNLMGRSTKEQVRRTANSIRLQPPRT